MLSRRSILKSAVALTAVSSATSLFAKKQSQVNWQSNGNPNEERYWQNVASYYDVNKKVINLENGYWGVMAKPVIERFAENTAFVNQNNSYFARREYDKRFAAIRAQLADRLDVDVSELMITRGATEALQNIITGYQGLEKGDVVMYCDLDYGSIQSSMVELARRNQCEIIKLDIPQPATHQNVIDVYHQAFERYPKTKFLLLTHVSHRTGLLMPVREIISIAKQYNIDVVVDAAHSWGQLDFTVPELGSDLVGFNLHKWIGAPIGVGLMVIRKNQLINIAPNISANNQEKNSIEGRVHTGTMNFATVLTINDALKFHDFIGAENKPARLRYLRNLWVNQVHDVDGIEVLTPNDERLHAGITSFRLKGKESIEDNMRLVKYLLDEHNIHTVHRKGTAKGACVRVTPSYYNQSEDMNKLAFAILQAKKRFLSKVSIKD